MKRYLLDTGSAADCIFRRRGVDQRVKQARKEGGKIGIAIPVLAELLAGVEFSATRERNLEIVNRNLRLFRLWPFTVEAAREYARLYAGLRRSGINIQQVDMMVAAIARTLGDCTVVSADTDLGCRARLSRRELGGVKPGFRHIISLSIMNGALVVSTRLGAS
jgi:tRNA(fMet)-specific endonuclease VapC